MSVNADPLPTISLITPSLHRKIFFCTFADVSECPDLCTPSAEGRGHQVNLNISIIWQKVPLAVPVRC